MANLERAGSNGRHRLAARLNATPLAATVAAGTVRPLREQIARAARVQRSLLPDVSVPVGEFRLASLYWPCEMLGGDFYDLAWRHDCAVILVADVMGHGAEAALITMLVKAAFLDIAVRTGVPRELLAEMSARLYRLVPEAVFVAAAVARLDLEGPGVQLANAGLPHPFLLRASERRVEELPLDGVPLGLSASRDPGAHGVSQLSLAGGDVLLIASDGLGSVESDRGQFFDERRMRSVLEGLAGCDGSAVIDRLAFEAVDFGHGRDFADDINLIAVSRCRIPPHSLVSGSRVHDSDKYAGVAGTSAAGKRCEGCTDQPRVP